MKIRIPKKLTNDRTLQLMKFLRLVGRRPGRKRRRKLAATNLAANKKAFRRHREKVVRDGGFIEDQHAFDDMPYGKATVRHAGCEIIAVYNVMLYLTGRKPGFPKMIAAFEKNGMIFNGRLGTDPEWMKRFLVRQGFHVVEYRDTSLFMKKEGTERKGDRRQPDAEAYLLTFYNDGRDLLQGIHTVAVTGRKRKYFLHNHGGRTAAGPYQSVDEILLGYEKRGARIISILCIRKQTSRPTSQK